jgi:hypothetical protein
MCGEWRPTHGIGSSADRPENFLILSFSLESATDSRSAKKPVWPPTMLAKERELV